MCGGCYKCLLKDAMKARAQKPAGAGWWIGWRTFGGWSYFKGVNDGCSGYDLLGATA